MAEGGGAVVTSQCLQELLEFFANRGNPYRASHTDRSSEIVEKMCLHLLARDYTIQTVDNSQGQLCSHYPAHLFIMNQIDEKDATNRVDQLKELFKAAKMARSLCRFPVPVILIGHKNVCRSSTLSTAMELYGRSGLDWMFSGKSRVLRHEAEQVPQQRERRLSEWALVDQAREFDSQLLKALGVVLVCDLMVEMRKTQYGVTVTSSEKADGNLWYSDFCIASIPYPGCEFFVQYQERIGKTDHLLYNWNLPMNDADISVPSPLSESVGINFTEYKSWNIFQHTQNYLKLILHYLQYEEGGVLIHCVAGWDRTPLFISLLRLSLWADGHVHKSLEPHEILYLTLAYDWFIFGHKFEERLRKKEEVMFFCFDFLQHITSEEFRFRMTTPTDTRTDTREEEPMRAQRLRSVRDIFRRAYDRAIPRPSLTESSRVGGASEMLTGLWGHMKGYFPRT